MLLIALLSKCTSGTRNGPVTHDRGPSAASVSDALRRAATPYISPSGVAGANCDYYSGPTDPPYVMRNGFIDWEAYWARANAYARQRAAQYTSEERLLAKAIWSEQKTDAATADMRAARHRAMVAIGYVIIHRRDATTGWFGSTNTLQAVLEDTRESIQFYGYWNWMHQDVIEDYIVRSVESGRVIQPGVGWESPDRQLWFDALDIARGVLQGCEADVMPGSLYFGHGAELEQIMQLRAQADSTFVYWGIADLQLWIANKPFRE